MNVLLCINGYKKIYVYYFNINKQIDVNKKNQYQESCVLFFPRHNQYQRFWSWYHQDKNKIIEEYLYILNQVCYVTDIVKQMNIVKKNKHQVSCVLLFQQCNITDFHPDKDKWKNHTRIFLYTTSGMLYDADACKACVPYQN